MTDSIERIYRSIPQVECKGHCQEACGPIEMGDAERKHLADKGITIPRAETVIAAALAWDTTTACVKLVGGLCSIYDDRPLICRLWGAVESMPCPWDCTVTPGLLMDAGSYELINRSIKLEVL